MEAEAVGRAGGTSPQALTELRNILEGAVRKALVVSVGEPGDGGGEPEIWAEAAGLLAFAPLPTAAVIRGRCLDSLFLAALACSFRFAAAGTRCGFSAPEPCGPLAELESALHPRAREALRDLALAGRDLTAEEALARGLVDRVLPADQVEEAARFFLEDLVARRPAPLVRAVMESVHGARRLGAEAALRRETEIFLRTVAGRG